MLIKLFCANKTGTFMYLMLGFISHCRTKAGKPIQEGILELNNGGILM